MNGKATPEAEAKTAEAAERRASALANEAYLDRCRVWRGVSRSMARCHIHVIPDMERGFDPASYIDAEDRPGSEVPQKKATSTGPFCSREVTLFM